MASVDRGPKWGNLPVTFHEGTMAEIRAHIPTFERRSFGLTQGEKHLSRLNERLDTIVRRPFGEDKTFVPVGIVSKDYTLVPHDAVLNEAIKALGTAKVAPDDVRAEVKITEYGERMALSLYLPGKYSFDPGDGKPMALRLECMNSVDGSTRFRALVGWFRLVCSNGLIIGVTRSDMRRRHTGDIFLADVGKVLKSGLKEAENEKKNFARWRGTEITLDRIAPWVEKKLWKGWGFKAAARTFHIACYGADADVVGQFKGRHADQNCHVCD